MKRILLLLLLLQFNTESFAYRSMFGQNTTEWTIMYVSYGTPSPNTYYDTVVVVKDTIVNGLLYKKIKLKKYKYTGGLLREDTLLGKVWFKNLSEFSGIPKDTLEVLAFDYSLKKGDTFNVDNINYALGGPTLDSLRIVDTVYYANGLKHIQFKGLGGGWIYDEPLKFVEGIGGTFTVLWKEYDGFLNSYLLCSYKDGIQTPYANIFYMGKCNPSVGIDNVEPKKENILLYPQPATKAIYINNQSNYKIEKINLIDLKGRTLPCIYNDSNINVADITQGYYVVQILLSNGSHSKHKILIIN